MVHTYSQAFSLSLRPEDGTCHGLDKQKLILHSWLRPDFASNLPHPLFHTVHGDEWLPPRLHPSLAACLRPSTESAAFPLDAPETPSNVLLLPEL